MLGAEFQCPAELLRGVPQMLSGDDCDPLRWQEERVLRQQLRGRFHDVCEAVAELRKETIPASSSVENLTTSRQRAKSTAGTERIGHGGATHQTANLCSKLNCASLPRPQGRAGARLFQQPDLENHWVPMRNRALPSVMAFVAQATHPAGALLRDRQAAA